MKTQLLVISSVMCAFMAHAQAPEGADIFIADLTTNNNQLQLGELSNITNRPGYDNQPYFLPHHDGLLYTAEINGQTDIFHHDLVTGTSTNLTDSPQSEYSPTPMSDGKSFSVIYSAQGNQQLWQYQLDGSEQQPLLQNPFKIGYHAWIDQQRVLITVLQEQHMELRIADVETDQATTVANNTGASLYAIPGDSAMSFNTALDGEHWLMKLDPATSKVSRLVRLPSDARYYAWTPDGKVLVASQSQLWFWDRHSDADSLQAFANIQAACPSGASRIAVNSQQSKLALVCHAASL